MYVDSVVVHYFLHENLRVGVIFGKGSCLLTSNYPLSIFDPEVGMSVFPPSDLDFAEVFNMENILEASSISHGKMKTQTLELHNNYK
jgi:hypothetical protein